MTDLLADYREWASAQEERVGTHSGRCHLWHDRCLIHRLARELERTRAALLQADRTPGADATPGEGSVRSMGRQNR